MYGGYVSTKARGEKLLQDPTFSRGVVGVLQIEEDAKDKHVFT